MQHNIMPLWSLQGNSSVRIWEWTTLQEQAIVFSCHSTVSDVVTAGEKALVSLFGGKPGVVLNALRYQHYFEKMATNTSHVELQNLRPTAAASAQFYSLRVYVHVKQWQGEGAGMSMEDWGWTVTKYFLLQRTCPLFQNRFFSYSDVTGCPAVAVWDAFFAIMICSVPQPNCLQRVFVHKFFKHCRQWKWSFGKLVYLKIHCIYHM